MRPIWFQGHVAYTMAKYNMSLCALGMAAEFQDQGESSGVQDVTSLLKI